jgi:CRP-like cAMP-binding protein
MDAVQSGSSSSAVVAAAEAEQPKPALPRIASSHAEKRAIYEFRYRFYVGELQRNVPGTNHDEQVVQEPHDDVSTQFYVCDQRGEIGAVMTETTMDCPITPSGWRKYFRLELFEDSDMRHTSVSSRLLVRPDLRRSMLLISLLAFSYDWALRDGRLHNLNYCAPMLVKLYEQLGYRRYAPGFNTPEGTYRIPMVFLCRDVQHLETIKSPLLRTARKAALPKHEYQTRVQKAAAAATAINSRTAPDEAIWKRFHGAIAAHGGRCTLIDGLDESHARQLVRGGVLIEFRKGDCLSPQGELSREIYALASGELRETYARNGTSRLVRRLGAGALAGPVSFYLHSRRSTRIDAVSDGAALLLDVAAIENVTPANSAWLFRVERNFAREMETRLLSAGYPRMGISVNAFAAMIPAESQLPLIRALSFLSLRDGTISVPADDGEGFCTIENAHNRWTVQWKDI